MAATASGSFGSVQLPDWNFLLDTSSGKTTADVARTQIGNQSGQLANQLAANTLGSNTQIAANTAEAGGLANQYAGQRNPLEITLLKQQTGQESSPVFDKLMGVIGGGAGQPTAPTGGSAPANGDFIDRMNQSESSGRPGVVNAGGYAGNFQFGAPRLSELGLYTPAPGEINGKTWNGQMAGTFNIPGFPDVKTKADFLANPQAQRAAMGAQVADIDQAIAQTPGADKFDRNGLRAVAHLGGVEGMQKYVATGGQYNPGDNPKAPGGGTHLSDYYGKFSGSGGALALQQAHGHPEGPLPSVAAAPGVTLAPDAQTAAAPAPAPVQTATRGPMPGDTANDGTSVPQGPAPGFGPDGQPLPAGSWDAAPVASAAPAAPTGQGLPDVMARLRAGQAASADAAPQVQNPNALLSVASPDGSVAQPAPNALAGPAPVPAAAPVQQQPQAAPAAQPGTGMNSPQVQQAQALLHRATQIDMIAAQAPNDPRIKALAAAKAAELRGQAQVLMQADSVTVDPVTGLQTHTLTGKQDNAAIPVHNPSRVTKIDGPNGIILTQPGSPDRVIPYGGRPEQTDAYKTDIPKAEALTAAAQSAQASMPRLNEMATLAGQLSTGPTAEVRAKAAGLLEQLGASPESIKHWTGMPSGSASQEFVKLAIATAGSAAKADVGSNNGIQSTQLYQAANPNLGLLPDANKRITNMMRVSAQSIQDYAQAALQHFGTNEATFLKGGNYAPLTTFNREWQAQSNPQVYAAATGILNGDSFDKWSAKISPAEGARAAQIAARVDPTVQVPLKGGGLAPVKQILSHPSITPAAQ